MPPPKPVRLPSLPITRWQGMTMGSGFLRWPNPLPAPLAAGRCARRWRRNCGFRRRNFPQRRQHGELELVPERLQPQLELPACAGEILAQLRGRRGQAGVVRAPSPAAAPPALASGKPTNFSTSPSPASSSGPMGLSMILNCIAAPTNPAPWTTGTSPRRRARAPAFGVLQQGSWRCQPQFLPGHFRQHQIAFDKRIRVVAGSHGDVLRSPRPTPLMACSCSTNSAGSAPCNAIAPLATRRASSPIASARARAWAVVAGSSCASACGDGNSRLPSTWSP